MKTATVEFDEKMAKGSLEAGSLAVNRARSNTWSIGCQLPMTTTMTTTTMTEVAEDESVVLTSLNCSSAEADSSGSTTVPGNKDPVTNFRKNWTRRNAWGNLSYAELITKAIESSPEKRLTLSQIYDWIVHNVDYFANKGDNSSSAGWKNSIRHNLSLHSRFVRLVNDGAGKSSWWSLNPDAQPLKPSRRRAATLDNKALRKRTCEAGNATHRKQDFAGRSISEVDSTTSGPVFSTSLMVSPGNSSQGEVTAMDIGLNGSPSRYPRENGFRKAGLLSGTVPREIGVAGDTSGRSGSGSPSYGVPDGFRMDMFGGKVPDHDQELCMPGPENLSMHGKGQLNVGSRAAPHGKQRRYVPTSLEDRSISLGFCAGNGIFYDDVFDPHSAPGNSYYSKRYFDETGGYSTGLSYGNCHSNGYYPEDAYTGGFYGNGVGYDNRTLLDGKYAGESSPMTVQEAGSGPREVNGGASANGQGICAGGFPEVRNAEQNAARSKGVATGDENRELDAFPIARYCSLYVDLEGGKGTEGYDADLRAFRVDNDCFRDDGLPCNPSVSRFQDEAPKTESSLFFRALTTTSGYAEEDHPSNPGALKPVSSPGLSSHEPYYRATNGSKYPYLPDPTAKPFSQLLANRATYPTRRNASTINDFYIPTTF